MNIKNVLKTVLILVIITTFFNCKGEKKEQVNTITEAVDPLPSWNDSASKQAIISYVVDVTNTESENFIPIADRISTFDNDGNLWGEQPAYFQLFFAIDRVKAMAPEHPEWKNQQPFKAILENDMSALAKQGMKGLMELIMTTHAGMTTDEFTAIVKDWVKTAKHPTKNVGFDKMIYQPMVELLQYLRANDFKT